MAELKRIGIEAADVEVFPAIRPIDVLGFPSIGTLGCYLSHLAVLKTPHYRATVRA